MLPFMETEKAAVRASLDEIVGANVHMLMWARKITQVALAGKMGIDQSGLSKRLRGERSWSLDEVDAAARILGVTVVELLERKWYTPRDSNPEPTDYGNDNVVPIDWAPSLRFPLTGGSAA